MRLQGGGLATAILPFLCLIAAAERDPQIYCGACIAMALELEWQISQISPKKKLQIGSFRIDPQGNQKLKSIPLSKSEAQLTEEIEIACSQISSYAQTYDNVTHQTAYVRQTTHDGATVSLGNYEVNTETNKKMKFACEFILEENEDEIIKLYQIGPENSVSRICTDMLELCSAENVTAQSVAMTRGLAAAVVEAEEKAVEEAKKAEEEAKRAAEEARTAAEEATTADTADEDSTAEADGENEKSADEREEGEDADVKNEDDGGTVPAERQEL